MAVMSVTDQSFQSEVLEADLPVLVDFWAPWCGPCRMVSPVVDAIGEEYAGKLRTCKLNVDENQQTSFKYQVMSIPTLIVFKGGKAVLTLVGFRPKEALMKEIDKVIG